MPTYLSNQTFAGGFDTGMVQAGFELVHKTEMKGGFGLANCRANRHILGRKWTWQATDPAEWEAPDADVVVANPPCSGWSVMSSGSFRGPNSPALSCTWAFAEYVARVRPLIAVFESVQQAYTHPEGLTTMRALRNYVEEKTNRSWTLHHVLHNAYSVGGPAQRRRYFWVASRVPFGVEPPEPRPLPLLRDVIDDVATLGRSWYEQPYRAQHSAYARQFISPSGLVDGHYYMRNPLVGRIHDLLDAVEWLPGESIATVIRRHYDRFGKLPESFAHQEQKIVQNDFAMGFTTPTRWDGDRPGRVITGGSLQMVLHPWLDRMITHREAARILGFPDDWKIAPLRREPGLYMTWGKGITTHCGRWIGTWLRRALAGSPGSQRGEELGDREYVIDNTNDWKKFPSSTRESAYAHVVVQ